MRYHLSAFFTSAGSLIWLALFVLFVTGHLHLDAALGCALLSGMLAAFTYIQRNNLLINYAAPITRHRTRFCLYVGPAVAIANILFGGLHPVSAVGVISLVFWVSFWGDYEANKKLFVRRKSGLVPKDAWPCPPPDAILPGDFIFTEGVIGPKLGMAVDHGELALRNDKGDMVCFSSWWGNGTVFTPIQKVTKGSQKKYPYYVLRPKVPLTEAQAKRLFEIAGAMFKDNHEKRDEEIAHRTQLVESLWLPRGLKDKLLKRILPDGYDWFGLVIGRRRKYSWTCIGAGVEAYTRLIAEEKAAGRPVPETGKYGIGFMGLGTGVGDPVAPIKVMTDPALRFVDFNDKAEFEASHPELALQQTSSPETPAENADAQAVVAVPEAQPVPAAAAVPVALNITATQS